MAWPDSVPILEEHHIDRKCDDPDKDAKDLITWLETTFCDMREQGEAHLIMCVVAEELTGYSSATEACDDFTIPVSVLVDIWTSTMERLGYEL